MLDYFRSWFTMQLQSTEHNFRPRSISASPRYLIHCFQHEWAEKARWRAAKSKVLTFVQPCQVYRFYVTNINTSNSNRALRNTLVNHALRIPKKGVLHVKITWAYIRVHSVAISVTSHLPNTELNFSSKLYFKNKFHKLKKISTTV